MKKSFGKAAPKTVKPAAAKPAAAAKRSPAGKTAGAAEQLKQAAVPKKSIAKRMIDKVATTATGAVSAAVAKAAAAVGKGEKPSRSKAKTSD